MLQLGAGKNCSRVAPISPASCAQGASGGTTTDTARYVSHILFQARASRWVSPLGCQVDASAMSSGILMTAAVAAHASQGIAKPGHGQDSRTPGRACQMGGRASGSAYCVTGIPFSNQRGVEEPFAARKRDFPRVYRLQT